MQQLSRFLSLLCLLFTQFITAQNDSIANDSIVPKKYRRIKISLNYSSANTILGRRDSVAIPLLSPSFKYTSSKNFFTTISFIHTNTTSRVFDELDTKFGYRFFIGDRWDGSVSYSHYFFASEVTRLNSLVNHDINAYLGCDLTYFYTALSFDYTAGKKVVPYKNKFGKIVNYTAKLHDYNLTWMNYYQFEWEVGKRGTFILTPEVDLIFGTQNNIALYRNALLLNPKLANASSFNLKSVNYNLDLLYIIGRYSINLSPFYAVPYHVTNVASNKPYFVMYGGLFYTYKWEKKPHSK